MNLLQLYFSPNGRIGRKVFLLPGLTVWLISFITCLIALAAFFGSSETAIGGWIIIFWLFVYPLAMLLIKRLHDLNYSGWILLWVFFPFVLLIYVVLCVFKKGEAGSNRYGRTFYVITKSGQPLRDSTERLRERKSEKEEVEAQSRQLRQKIIEQQLASKLTTGTCTACGTENRDVENFVLYTASKTEQEHTDQSFIGTAGVRSTTTRTTRYKGIQKHDYLICRNCQNRSSKMIYVYISVSFVLSFLVALALEGLPRSNTEWVELLPTIIVAGPICLIFAYLILRQFNPERKLKNMAKRAHRQAGIVEVFTDIEYQLKFRQKSP